jgi:hypothetical protein
MRMLHNFISQLGKAALKRGFTHLGLVEIGGE